jgi:hypothetical protein
MDCVAFSFADVITMTEQLTLIGAFGHWWVLTSASASLVLPLRQRWASAHQAVAEARAAASASAAEAVRSGAARAKGTATEVLSALGVKDPGKVLDEGPLRAVFAAAAGVT